MGTNINANALPWHIETTNERDGIWGRDPEHPGCAIEITDRIWDHKHATLIVRACNSHAALLKAMKEQADGLERDARQYPDGHFPSASRFVNRAIALRAAIAQAEKGEHIDE
jgi:hypothetical protein